MGQIILIPITTTKSQRTLWRRGGKECKSQRGGEKCYEMLFSGYGVGITDLTVATVCPYDQASLTTAVYGVDDL